MCVGLSARVVSIEAGTALVDVPGGRHAHRASGAGDKFDLRWQDAADAQAEYFVRMGAAYLHDPELAPAVGFDDPLSRFHQATP